MEKISNIASVSFGINVVSLKMGKIHLIQSGSITEQGEYNPKNNLLINKDAINEDDYLQAGDILFPAKGAQKIPYVIKEQDLPVVASSVFFVIRTDREIILSEFLAWLLTTPQMYHQLSVISEGSTISSISIREFRSLMIQVPPLSVQLKITELNQLQKRYSTLTEQLQEKTTLLNLEIANQIMQKHHE